MTQMFSGMDYLKIDVASMFGLDKEVWDKRIEWFNAHENELESLIEQADARNCYLAAVNAYRDAKAGKPIGYPINLDATASGCQVLALLMGDKKAAMRVNLVNTGAREDLYTYIYNIMKQEAPVATTLTRDQVKKSIMTSLYGSEAKPKEVFGEANYEIFERVMDRELKGVWRLNKFLLNHWDPTKTEYSWTMPDNFHVTCTVTKKVQYEAKCLGEDISFVKEIKGCTEKGRFLSANLAHSVDGLINREITMRANLSDDFKAYLRKLVDLNTVLADFGRSDYNQSKASLKMFKTLWKRYEETGFLSARILQYVTPETLKLVGVNGIKDIRNLIDSLPEKSFEVFAIHDCFRVLPNYGNSMRQQYRYVCKQIAESHLLDHIVSSMFDTEMHFEKMSDDLGELVMHSEYAIC